MRRKKEVEGQMNLMDFLRETVDNKPAVKKRVKSREGEFLYLVGSHQMECVWVIESSADVDGKEIHICRGNSSENAYTISEEQIGVDVFTDINIARNYLSQKKAVQIISKKELEETMIEIESFALVRQTYAKGKKSGDTSLTFTTIAFCRQGIYCMDGSEPILHYYGDALENAAKQYKRMVAKIQSQIGLEAVKIPVHYEFCDLYQCSPSKYSSLRYYLSKVNNTV